MSISGSSSILGDLQRMFSLLLLLCFLRGSLQQLHIEVTQQGHPDGELLASYTHPRGLSLDWWRTSYINIPHTGLEGVLLHQPVSCLTSIRLPSVPENCHGRNFSLILLTPHLFSCPERIVRYAQENGYLGVITYGDGSLTIENTIYDPLYESFVNLQPTGLLFAAVDEKFANKLDRVAVSTSCSYNSYKLTKVSRGGTNVAGVKFGISLLLVVSMLFCLCIIVSCMNVTLKCFKRRSTGFYDVHSIQTQEIEFTTPTEAQEHSARSLYMPKTKTFDGSSKDATNSTCPICLDSFSQGEAVGVINCGNSHTFHPQCISKWLTSQNTCPVCRNQLQANL